MHFSFWLMEGLCPLIHTMEKRLFREPAWQGTNCPQTGVTAYAKTENDLHFVNSSPVLGGKHKGSTAFMRTQTEQW